MDPLQSTETIQQFLKLLEENGRQGQAADLSQLNGLPKTLLPLWEILRRSAWPRWIERCPVYTSGTRWKRCRKASVVW